MSKIKVNVMIIFVPLLLLLVSLSCQGQDAVLIEQIEIDSSQILLSSELEQVLQKYIGKHLTIADIEAMVDKINQLYLEKGYITARAILPEQTISEGTLRIQLIEGVYGETFVVGTITTKADYFPRMIGVAAGDLVQLQALEQGLFYFNVVNDVQVEAELQAGSKFGTTDLVLHVAEPERFSRSLTIDKAGRAETGLHRVGLSLLDRSVFGQRDSLSINLIGALGLLNASVGYTLPLNQQGAKLNFGLTKGITRMIAGDLANLNVKQADSGYNVAVSAPLIVEVGHRIDGSVQFNYRTSQTDFSGVTLLQNKLNTLNWNVSYQSAKPGEVWYWSYGFVQGTADFGTEDRKDPGTVKAFTKHALMLETQHVLSETSSAVIRANLQLSKDDLLPSSEQFVIGGISSVRGFDEGVLAGDQGYWVSVERSEVLSDQATLFIFVDNGFVKPYKGNEVRRVQDDILTSVGFGVRLALSEDTSAELVVGLPWQDNAIKPYIHYSWKAVW